MSNIALKLTPTELPELDSDRRESKRIAFYKGEFPIATIELGGKLYEAEVYDISSKGAGILPLVEIPGLDSISQTVTLRLHNAKPKTASLKNIGHIKFSGSYRLKLGMEIHPTAEGTANPGVQIACDAHMPMAYCEDPIAFKQTILFNVFYFSNDGIGLRTNFDNAAFFQGLLLDLSLMLPARGEFRAAAEVQATSQSGRQIDIHCKWRNCPINLQSAIAEFLLMSTPDLSITALRKHGFLIGNLDKAFIFRSAQTDEQVQSILELRLKSAQQDGRWIGETDARKMIDDWDKHARQIFCEVNGKVVGAARIVFNNGLRERSEHSAYGIEVPEWLWESGFVEGSRVCTDPDFRGGDLFLSILQHMSRIVTQSGHRYLVLNCVDSLVPVYKKTVGVYSLKKKFHTKYMQDRTLNLLYVDVRKIQIGLRLAPTTWIAHTPVGDHLLNKGHLRLHWWEKLPRRVMSPLHKLMLSAYEKKRTKRAKKR